MTDLLFSFGVFDDERTPRERAEKPVRCLEEELVPRLSEKKRCERCATSFARRKDTMCTACRHEVSGHQRSTKVKSAERLMARAKKAGYVDADRAKPEVIEYCLRQRWLKRAGPRDINRLGFNAHASIFLPVDHG